jgi:DNA-binding MarR family transcriptional regulator
MRWLTAEEQHTWTTLLRAIGELDSALDRQLMADSGITHGTYGILAALSGAADGTRHMSELAGLARFSQSRLSHAVVRLEQEGLLTREVCTHDKRGIHAVLTPQGRELMEQAAPGHVALVRQLVFDRLTPEQVTALGEIMQVVRTGLDESGTSR